MKKIWFALVALLALSFTFVSCGDFGWEVLDEDDITSSWCNGTWSGTTSVKTNMDEALSKIPLLDDFKDGPIDSIELTPNYLKTILAMEMSIDFGLAKSSIEPQIKSNMLRNKLEITIDFSETIGSKEYTATVTIKLTKD